MYKQTIYLFFFLIVFAVGEKDENQFVSEDVLQKQLPEKMQPDPREPFSTVSFVPKELEKDVSPVALLNCGAFRRVSDGSQDEIRSINFPSAAPLFSACGWRFRVPANTAVELMCYTFNVYCSALNRLYVLGGGQFAAICANQELTNTRIRIRPRSFEYTLKLTHVVKWFPRGRLRCVVRGSGGPTPPPTNPPATEPPTTPPQNEECGINKYRSKIIDGEVAQQDEWPWHTYLLLGNSLCGGTLINDQWVLTAAHCSSGVPLANIQVRTGCHRVTDCEPSKSVIRNILHPGYDASRLNNDVALLKLSEKVTFSDRVRPVCLPSTTASVGDTETTIGFGLTSDGGSVSNILREANVRVISDQECRNTFNILESVLCTRPLSGTICNGDSGSFLGRMRNGKYEQDGVTSFVSASGCNTGRPDGFSEVRLFIAWITNTINSN